MEDRATNGGVGLTKAKIEGLAPGPTGAGPTAPPAEGLAPGPTGPLLGRSTVERCALNAEIEVRLFAWQSDFATPVVTSMRTAYIC